MTGHFEIECAADASGRSFLARQSFCAPWHLSKPHHVGETLVVQVVNATAGLFAGDRLSLRATVQTGGRLLLTQPSATRAHRMAIGEAQWEQEFVVADGGALEVWPHLFIPHAGARCRQRTCLQVEAGGELVFFEKMAPGRAAMGEFFAFEALHWETDLCHAGRLLARERFMLTPETGSLLALREKFPSAYLATGFIVSAKLIGEATLTNELLLLHSDDVWIGCGRLAPEAFVLKLIARDSLCLHRAMAKLREQIHAVLRQKQ